MIARLVRLAGGDPGKVSLLYHALTRAAAGAAKLEEARQGRSGSFVLNLSSRRALVAVFVGLGSIGLAVGVGFAGPAAPWILGLSQAGLILFVAVGEAGPKLLADDDARCAGWWPVDRRDLALARLGLLVLPILQLSALLLALPLAVYLVTGRPPVLAAGALALGLLLQALFAAVVTALVVVALERRLGRRRAQRLVAFLSVAGIWVPYMLANLLDEEVKALLPRLQPLLPLLPVSWFVAWARAAAGRPAALALAGLSLLATTAALVVGFRLLLGRTAPAALAPVARRHRFGGADLVERWLRLFTRGREGFILRRVVTAHLREDWRLRGQLLGVALILFFLTGMPFARDSSGTSDLAVHLPLQIAALTAAALGLQLLSSSSEPRAAWILVQGDLPASGLAAAERGVVRALVLPFLAVGVGLSVARSPDRALWLGEMTGLALLGFELVLRLLQWMRVPLPFSRPHQDQQNMEWMVVLAVGGLAALLWFLWLYTGYRLNLLTRLLSWALLAGAVAGAQLGMERHFRRRAEAFRLPL